MSDTPAPTTTCTWSCGAFVQNFVPGSLTDAFTNDDWLAPVEPPAKRRKIDVEVPSESFLQEADSTAALLTEYLTATRYTVQLTFAGSDGDDEESTPSDSEEKVIPVTRVACTRSGPGTANITLQTKQEGRYQTLLSGQIDQTEDLPFRALAALNSVQNIRKNDPQPILFECSLRRFSQNDYTFFMDAAVLVRDSTEIPVRLHSSINALFNQAFPGLEAPLSEEEFTPGEFYSSVHVTSKEKTPTIQCDVLKCRLFPFQRRAVQWLVRREGADLQDDGTIVAQPSVDDINIPPSFSETQDADGRRCYASPYLRVLTSDLSDCWNVNQTVRGGILAEEMGLGKTVEIISLIALHKRNLEHKYEHHDLTASDGRPLIESGATLIVTPTVILSQWKHEFEKHAPGLKVFFYEGINTYPDSSEDSFLKLLARYDVVITTYHILRGEIHYSEDPPDRFLRYKKKNPLRRSPLVQISWWRVCLDEAQMVESGVSHAARVARVVPRVNAWAITGTPLKKDMNDLFGLLLFLHYEPFCSSVELWRRLYKSFKPLFKQIIGTIALRHTKDQIRGELEIPMQKRFLIKIPFTAVEEQKYRHIYAQMCDDCGLDFTGAPLRDEWDPNDRVIIDKMRRWLSRLRQTCLYSELSSGPTRVANTLAPSVDGPLRSVAEVLESMIEQNEADIFNEEKKWLMLMIRRGQILENALAPQRALAVWEQALEHATPIVAKYREQLQAELERRRAKKEEEEKGKKEEKEKQVKEKQEKEKAGLADGESDDDEDDDNNDNGKDDAEKRARKRLQGFHMRLRSALEVQHMCYFFIGNAYYQIKSNTELTKPESEQFYAMEKSEVAAYENAKQVRKELLAESNKDVSKWINKLRDTIQSKGLATVPDMILDIEEVGIESQRIIDRLDTLCAIMNEHATFYGKLRDHLVRMLLAQLVDQDDDTELEGNEYEVSAKHQDELVVYMEAIRVMNAYRFSSITGQMNEMISRDVASGLALANEGEGPCSQLYLKLLQECNRFAYSEGSDSLRSILTDLRNLINSLDWQGIAGNLRAQAEILILKPLLTQAAELNTAQSKVSPWLEQEVRFLTRVMNKRLDFYRQLQQISDMVGPYAEETKGNPLDEYAYNRHIESENQLESKISSMRSKHRYLIYLRDDSEGDEDSRMCVICQSQIEVGVLTVCGHKYCNDCYHLWWRNHRSCPTCKRRLTATESHSISFKPRELVAEEERPPDNLGQSLDVENPIYTNVSHGVLNEVMSTRLDYSYGTKIDTIAKHLLWLRQHDPGSKSVVFSQYRSFIMRLAGAFRKFNIGHSTVDCSGGIDAFQKNASTECILIHSKSQASGLNLTNATHIFLCEPLINTAIELQAIARIHRIGQRRETTVWMYLVNDSVEESIYDISVRRRMEHIARRARSKLGKIESKSGAGEVQGQLEEILDSANSLELQGNFVQKLTDPAADGEQVPEDDLWQCLFGKLKRAGLAPANRSATNEVDRVVRANAAENRNPVSG